MKKGVLSGETGSSSIRMVLLQLSFEEGRCLCTEFHLLMANRPSDFKDNEEVKVCCVLIGLLLSDTNNQSVDMRKIINMNNNYNNLIGRKKL